MRYIRNSVKSSGNTKRLAAIIKRQTTVNKLNDRNKMPTAHSGTFACPNVWATASHAKEIEFCHRTTDQNINFTN